MDFPHALKNHLVHLQLYLNNSCLSFYIVLILELTVIKLNFLPQKTFAPQRDIFPLSQLVLHWDTKRQARSFSCLPVGTAASLMNVTSLSCPEGSKRLPSCWEPADTATEHAAGQSSRHKLKQEKTTLRDMHWYTALHNECLPHINLYPVISKLWDVTSLFSDWT